MAIVSKTLLDVPPDQEVIRARSFHSAGTFVPFDRSEIQQSITDRFEKVVVQQLPL